MPVFRLDPDSVSFPYPEYAEESGLLAVGGDLSPERLLLAYSNGIFPWYNPGEEILWWSPSKRFIIRPSHIHVSKSMKKYFRKHKISILVNRDFSDTMHRCRILREFKEGTWITDEMEEAYGKLAEMGYAVSLESFVDGTLAGGLYGVMIGRCFFGESMFSEMKNGSKIALISLAQILEESNFEMIDCQFHTDHLESMGGEYIEWDECRDILHRCIEYDDIQPSG